MLPAFVSQFPHSAYHSPNSLCNCPLSIADKLLEDCPFVSGNVSFVNLKETFYIYNLLNETVPVSVSVMGHYIHA